SSYHYDGMGRIDLDNECIDHRCFEMATAYDEAGRIKQLTYPDQNGRVTGNSLAVTYVYGDDGTLDSIPGFVDHFKHDASGNTSEIRFSNGVSETWSFDTQRGWNDGVELQGPTSASPLLKQTLLRTPTG